MPKEVPDTAPPNPTVITGPPEMTEPPKKGQPDMRPGNQGVPDKALAEKYPQTHPGALSPGQYANYIAGDPPDADPDSDEMRDYAAKFSQAKARRRFG